MPPCGRPPSSGLSGPIETVDPSCLLDGGAYSCEGVLGITEDIYRLWTRGCLPVLEVRSGYGEKTNRESSGIERSTRKEGKRKGTPRST